MKNFYRKRNCTEDYVRKETSIYLKLSLLLIKAKKKISERIIIEQTRSKRISEQIISEQIRWVNKYITEQALTVLLGSADCLLSKHLPGSD